MVFVYIMAAVIPIFAIYNLPPMKTFVLFLVCVSQLLICTLPTGAQMQKLVIGPNNRFLVKEDGRPFVWIGETNWFFAQLPPETIDRILDTRSAQGFTIMFVSCRQNLYNGEGGTGPLDNPNEKWWSYLDEYIEKCKARNMYVGITLGWWGRAMNNSPEDLYEFGQWVGNRYREYNNIVWLTLGEAGGHSRKKTIPDEKLNALVKGIRDGDTGNKLLTVHADYRRGTSINNDAKLCDFNNWQTSQWCCVTDLPRNDDREWTVWEAIEFDYNQVYNGIPKPTLDSEAWYENNKDFCGATAYHIRRRAYFTLFAGAFGHTYGAGGMWDGLTERDSCSSTALESLDYPGAEDMGHLSSFLKSLGKSLLDLRPDQDLVESGNSDDYDYHIQSVSGENRSLALIYSASDRPYAINTKKLVGRKLSAAWYNPRNNSYQDYDGASLTKEPGIMEVDPPGDGGPGNDWILLMGSDRLIRKLPKQ